MTSQAEKDFKKIIKKYELESIFQFTKNDCYIALAAAVKKSYGYELTDAEDERYAIMKVQPKVRKEFKKAVSDYMLEHPDVVNDIGNMTSVKAKNYKDTISGFLTNATDYGDDTSEPNILEKAVYTPIVGIMDFMYDHF